MLVPMTGHGGGSDAPHLRQVKSAASSLRKAPDCVKKMVSAKSKTSKINCLNPAPGWGNDFCRVFFASGPMPSRIPSCQNPDALPMRILHTSDWHLGQHFIGKTRQAEHRALIAWLLEQVSALNIDAVLLAGDVFDTGAPPSYARELYHQLLAGVAAAGASLLVVGGNHDSAAHPGRNPPAAGRAARHGDSIRRFARWTSKWCCCRAATASLAHWCAPHRLSARAMCCAARPGKVPTTSKARCKPPLPSTTRRSTSARWPAVPRWARCCRIIATGHLTTVGASASESVREIYVGALEAFPTQAFPAGGLSGAGAYSPPTMRGRAESHPATAARRWR